MSAAESYHLWYYNTGVWKTTSFLGVPCQKSVSDLWNYQEILVKLKPQLLIEFGTAAGGSALYFAQILRLISNRARVVSVDVSHSPVHDSVRLHPAIELLEADALSPLVAKRIRTLRNDYPGPVFWIIDDDHSYEHVLAELVHLRELTLPGDYIVVEDGNVNGHPVLPDWGPGPYEALSTYFAEFPDDYSKDTEREYKFGFTFAVSGFLIRR